MIKTIKLEEAVGTRMAHDITEIRPGEFKGPAYQKGHLVCEADLCRLQRLGKQHLYLLDLEEDEIHENEAAAILAGALAGDGIVWDNHPREGKIKMSHPSWQGRRVNCSTSGSFTTTRLTSSKSLDNQAPKI